MSTTEGNGCTNRVQGTLYERENNTILGISTVDFVSKLVENSAQFQNHVVWNPIVSGGNL